MEDEFNGDEWLRSFWDGDVVSEPMPIYGEGRRPRNPVVDEIFQVAGLAMDYCERLVKSNHVFADQLLRSSTSVGSHTREAQSAESLADFYHKMKIAMKELEETEYRLDLCHLKPHYPHDPALVEATKKLFPLFGRILATTKRRLNERRK